MNFKNFGIQKITTIGCVGLIAAMGSISASAQQTTTFNLQKRNTDFSIDGGNGATLRQQVYLWNTSDSNVNQQWVETEVDNGFYSYRKQDTSLCLDGGNGAAQRQAVILFTCDDENENQHWEKIDQAGGSIRLKKRGFSFSIDGDRGAERRQVIYLWNSGDSNVNQHWIFRDVGSSSSSSSSSSGSFGLSPNLQPWENFDLSVWGLDSPALREISANDERGVRIDDFEFIALREGENNSDFDDAEDLFFGSDSDVESSAPYFFTGPDGGMVFKSPVNGGRTSTNARFPRSELREYARAGVTNRPENGESIAVSGLNENNWVLGYQPQNLILDDNNRSENILNVGGRNGRLTATLRVNKVTETGRDDDIGVTIIGQIHAESDEPLRLYYRKLPQNELGSVYFLHEIRGDMEGEDTGRDGDDLDEIVLVGSRDDDASNPIGGIALDELFSYEIINQGSLIEVVLRRGDADGEIISRRSIDMATVVNDGIVGSGYDRRNEWMYFKAGVYTQNNAAVEDGEPGADTTGFGPDGTEADYDQATFYRLSVSHDENDCDDCSNL